MIQATHPQYWGLITNCYNQVKAKKMIKKLLIITTKWQQGKLKKVVQKILWYKQHVSKKVLTNPYYPVLHDIIVSYAAHCQYQEFITWKFCCFIACTHLKMLWINFWIAETFSWLKMWKYKMSGFHSTIFQFSGTSV